MEMVNSNFDTRISVTKALCFSIVGINCPIRRSFIVYTIRI